MKLVEILARELKEWPATTACYAQDDNGKAYPFKSLNISLDNNHNWGRLIGGASCMDYSDHAPVVKSTNLAYDYKTAIVTREMWEQERAKMNEWNGVGLPPIYTRVSIKHKGFDQGTGKVVFFGHVFCVIVNDKGHEQSGRIEHYTFSPFKTFEQIAAEERLHAIDEMDDLIIGWGVDKKMLAVLYDAGYRKTGDVK